MAATLNQQGVSAQCKRYSCIARDLGYPTACSTLHISCVVLFILASEVDRFFSKTDPFTICARSSAAGYRPDMSYSPVERGRSRECNEPTAARYYSAMTSTGLSKKWCGSYFDHLYVVNLPLVGTIGIGFGLRLHIWTRSDKGIRELISPGPNPHSLDPTVQIYLWRQKQYMVMTSWERFLKTYHCQYCHGLFLPKAKLTEHQD